MAHTVTDPVCGMEFEESDAAASVSLGASTYYFCSDACRDQFVADPARWSGPEGGFRHDHG